MTDNRNIREMIRQIASERPDFVYPGIGNSCLYRPMGDDNVRCIIGEALHRMGIPYDRAWESDSAFTVIGNIGGFTTEDKRWCLSVQSKQDGGSTWSFAVKFADDIESKQPERT